MVVLRGGLCPGLTAEMVQLLKANSITTGKSVMNASSGASTQAELSHPIAA
uniref:RAD51D N-terminal domain-containing protein n=1 Tax=Pelusios castaneus TaxID=367368 RepID=A0A8C8S8W3_9SAUR